MNPSGGDMVIGGPSVQPSALEKVDRSQTTREVIDNLQSANSPLNRMKKGGYVKKADGIAKRGKTRGTIVMCKGGYSK